jgi:hypothetical protein
MIHMVDDALGPPSFLRIQRSLVKFAGVSSSEFVVMHGLVGIWVSWNFWRERPPYPSFVVYPYL